MLSLLAKPIIAELYSELSQRASVFKTVYKRSPKLVVVLVGDDPASVIYTTRKGEAAQKIGIEHETIRFPLNVSPEEVKSILHKLNLDAKIDGILIQRPLPQTFDHEKILTWVAPEKDVDSFHPENVGKLFLGIPGLRPCTPLGIMTLLHYYKIPLSGKRVCIIGRSNIVGKPLAAFFLQENSTVIQCHSKTQNLAEMTKQADILVAATGKPNLITSSHVRPNSVVIDVGINRTFDGKIQGDVDYEKVSKIVSAITPVPGGVGPMTIAMLLSNTIKAAERRQED